MTQHSPVCHELKIKPQGLTVPPDGGVPDHRRTGGFRQTDVGQIHPRATGAGFGGGEMAYPGTQPRREICADRFPVSYTHLTLPTIYSV